MTTTFSNAIDMLRAAAEPTRLRLLALCGEIELTVSELTEILAQSQPRVSRHLKLLVGAGLLTRVREGTNAFYRTVSDGPAAALVHDILDAVDREGDPIAADRSRLAEIRDRRTAQAGEYFKRNAASWDRIRSLHVDEHDVERALLARVPDNVRNYLDLGTGTGRILELIAPRAQRAAGLDLSREMLAIARSRLERSGFGHCTLRHGDLYRLPWPAGQFDLVTVHQVLHYTDDPAGAIAEAARVMAPGGRLIVVDFAPHELDDLRVEHAHRRLGLDGAEMANWCAEAGLDLIEEEVLPGNKLTVVVWTADRAVAPARAGARG